MAWVEFLSFYEVAVERSEVVAPGVEAQEGVVAVAQDASSRKESFDGGQAGVGVGVDLGVAGISGTPARGDGTSFDGFHRFAHLCSMTPVGVEKEEWAAGIGGRERRRAGGEQEMARKVGLLTQGIAQKIQSRGPAKGLNRALGAVFSAADDDEDGKRHGGKGRQVA